MVRLPSHAQDQTQETDQTGPTRSGANERIDLAGVAVSGLVQDLDRELQERSVLHLLQLGEHAARRPMSVTKQPAHESVLIERARASLRRIHELVQCRIVMVIRERA